MQTPSSIPNGVFALLIANGIVYALQNLYGNALAPFALWSLNTGNFMPWQLVTYGFMHSAGPNGTFMHIFFNMFGLWMFGREIEHLMGTQRFVIFWFVCIVGAGIVQLLVSVVTGEPSVTIGASGAVFGVLLAFAMAFPNRTIVLLIPPIPMRAKYFVLFYGLITLFLGVSGGAPSVAHFAHLGGMLFGYLLIRMWTRPRPSG
ncbi:MAG: rhomboid family intramembrane serine protease [Woeseiaceae bacterium]|nr:rhomboid family intramembrane serine protease [Woeseiaceae bacterium]